MKNVDLFENSLFYQTHQRLNGMDERLFRLEYIHPTHKGQKRCFTIVFEVLLFSDLVSQLVFFSYDSFLQSESGLDCGGPYRELFGEIAEVFFSFSLLSSLFSLSLFLSSLNPLKGDSIYGNASCSKMWKLFYKRRRRLGKMGVQLRI